MMLFSTGKSTCLCLLVSLKLVSTFLFINVEAGKCDWEKSSTQSCEFNQGLCVLARRIRCVCGDKARAGQACDNKAYSVRFENVVSNRKRIRTCSSNECARYRQWTAWSEWTSWRRNASSSRGNCTRSSTRKCVRINPARTETTGHYPIYRGCFADANSDEYHLGQKQWRFEHEFSDCKQKVWYMRRWVWFVAAGCGGALILLATCWGICRTREIDYEKLQRKRSKQKAKSRHKPDNHVQENDRPPSYQEATTQPESQDDATKHDSAEANQPETKAEALPDDNTAHQRGAEGEKPASPAPLSAPAAPASPSAPAAPAAPAPPKLTQYDRNRMIDKQTGYIQRVEKTKNKSPMARGLNSKKPVMQTGRNKRSGNKQPVHFIKCANGMPPPSFQMAPLVDRMPANVEDTAHSSEREDDHNELSDLENNEDHEIDDDMMEDGADNNDLMDDHMMEDNMMEDHMMDDHMMEDHMMDDHMMEDHMMDENNAEHDHDNFAGDLGGME